VAVAVVDLRGALGLESDALDPNMDAVVAVVALLTVVAVLLTVDEAFARFLNGCPFQELRDCKALLDMNSGRSELHLYLTVVLTELRLNLYLSDRVQPKHCRQGQPGRSRDRTDISLLSYKILFHRNRDISLTFLLLLHYLWKELAIETTDDFFYFVEIHVLYSTTDFANEISNETMIHLNKNVICF